MNEIKRWIVKRLPGYYSAFEIKTDCDDANVRIILSLVPDMVEALKQSLSVFCTGYENGIAEIKIDDAGPIIGKIKDILTKLKGGE